MIDNFLPILEEEERLAFTCSSNEGELWPSLLEKACAKVHGSYYALEGGSVDDALVDLTGGVSSKTNLSTPDSRAMIESGQMWRQVRGHGGEGREKEMTARAHLEGERRGARALCSEGLDQALLLRPGGLGARGGLRLTRLPLPGPSVARVSPAALQLFGGRRGDCGALQVPGPGGGPPWP